jgi:hypothetical protein
MKIIPTNIYLTDLEWKILSKSMTAEDVEFLAYKAALKAIEKKCEEITNNTAEMAEG